MMQKVPEGQGKRQGVGRWRRKGRGEGETKKEVRFTTVSVFWSKKKRSGTSSTPGNSQGEENVVKDQSCLALQ